MDSLVQLVSRGAWAALFGACVSVAAAADAPAAAWESGADIVPLCQLEQQVRGAAGDGGRRAACEAALLPLLAAGSTFEAKRFACEHLAVVGSEASLPALTALLRQEETAGVACLALGGMRTAKAGDALRAALAEAGGTVRRQLVETLAHRAEAASVGALATLTRDADVALAGAAVHALGAIDAPEAREAVLALRGACPPALAAAVGAASLRGAEHAFAAGDRVAASAVCEELLAPTWPAHIRRGALGLLLRTDADHGARRVREILSAAASDPLFAAVAIGHVAELPGEGVSKTFADLLPRLPPAGRVQMVEALAERGDPDARSALRAQAAAEDPAVRCAALAAIGGLEGASAVDVLVKALTSGPTPDERQAAQAALAGLGGGEATDRALIGALRGRSAEEKAVLLATLSMRGGRASAAELLAQACAPEAAVARAAAQGLVRVAGRGDGAAFEVLRAAVAGDDGRAQEAALRALAAWRGLDAWEVLAEVYAKAEDTSRRTLALRGLVRAAGEANEAFDAGQAARYRQLLASARNAGERKLILDVLGGATHPEALALAVTLLDDPESRPVAEEAVTRLAKALAATHAEASRAALERVKSGKK